METLRTLGDRLFAVLDPVREVPIHACYHFRGFRYGGFGNNPYEDYVLGIASGAPRQELRAGFARSLLDCRPRTMDEALGLDLHGWPIWEYPWNRRPDAPVCVVDPALNPDIVCHDCRQGVLASHINREFRWLEEAWQSLSTAGYRPREFGYLRCMELVGDDGSSYLMLDGNHRLSALHAMGHATVEVRLSKRHEVRRAHVDRWPRVREGSLSRHLALKVFDRYFRSENPDIAPMNRVPLIEDEAPQWPAALPHHPGPHSRPGGLEGAQS